MKKYDNYKDSGIEWLGEIPEHWKVTKLKFIGDAIGGLTYAPNNVVDNKNEGVLVLRSSNIQNGKLSLKDNVFVNLEISDKLTLKKGDILICSRNGSQHLIGKNICIDERTEGSTFGAFMMIFRSKYYGFLNQYFNSPIFTSQSGLFLTATINQLTSGTLNNFYIAIPETIEEQTVIANYLDHKTTRIDTLIAKKEQFISLLQEERTAVINQAVTKGLDPKVKMKDSGIEWLGEIPEHWNIIRLKYLVSIRYGLGQPPNQKIDGLPIIRATNIFRGVISEKDMLYVDPDDLPMNRNPILKENEILVVRSGAYTADSAIVTKKWEGAVTGYDLVITPENVNAKLLSYSLLSTYMLENQLFIQRLRAAQPHLNSEELGETFMLLPPQDEQELIVDWLEKELNKILELNEKVKIEIELLKEYKTALISEVVTGKVDVRDVVLN